MHFQCSNNSSLAGADGGQELEGERRSTENVTGNTIRSQVYHGQPRRVAFCSEASAS